MAIADRAVRAQAGPVDLVTLTTQVRDVVTIRGSVDTTPDFASGGEVLQEWLTRSVDKGTTKTDRFDLAARLEDLGAQVGFGSSTARVRFSARCLRPDLETVVSLLFEQLVEPALAEAELAKAKERLRAAIQRGISDAGYRADVALAEAVHGPGHPNHMLRPDSEESFLAGFGPQDVRRYHHAQLLSGAPRLVIVGDVDPADATALVARAAADWRGAPGQEASLWAHADAPESPRTLEVKIQDRDNLEVRWGHPLALTRLDASYLPAYLASFVLGGNFSARLMNEVRDKRGLTYGIGSSLRGLDARYTGMWRVNVTLSQDNLDAGIAATEEVIERFSAEGITEAELVEKQDTLAGSYQVRLATTGGLAGSLLQQLEDGRPLHYVDDYPDRIRACTLGQVNEAIARHFDPARLVRVVAGSIPG